MRVRNLNTSVGIKTGVPGGGQFNEGDLNETGPSPRNTDTKTGKKKTFAQAAAAAVGVSSKEGKMSEKKFTILRECLWKNALAWNKGKI